MSFSLKVLIACEDARQAVLLSNFLTENQHQPDTVVDGLECLRAIKGRLEQDDPYDLTFCSLLLPSLDALSLLEQTEKLRPRPRMALIAPPSGLPRGLGSRLQQLGCDKVLSAPINLRSVEAILCEIGVRNQPDPTPFFGSTRITRSNSGRIRSTGYQSPSDRYPRQSSDPFIDALPGQGPTAPQPAIAPPADLPGPDPFTGSYQRQGSVDSDRRHPTTSSHQHPKADTRPSARQVGTGTHIRRSVTGRIERDQANTNPETRAAAIGTGRIIQVQCAHCGRSFAVPERQVTYNTVCIHCGDLNRILPA